MRGTDLGALDRFRPGPANQRLAVDVDLEVDGQVEGTGVAGLGRARPDLGLELVLLPAVEDVGVEDGPGGIGFERGHRQGLGGIEPATVLEEILSAVVHRDGHGSGDDVVRDPPHRRVRASSAVESRGVWRRGLEGRHRGIARPAGGWDDRQNETGRSRTAVAELEGRVVWRRPDDGPGRRRDRHADPMTGQEAISGGAHHHADLLDAPRFERLWSDV